MRGYGDQWRSWLWICACPRSKRKTAWASNAKLGTMHDSRSAYALTLRSKGQRSRSRGVILVCCWVQRTVTSCRRCWTLGRRTPTRWSATRSTTCVTPALSWLTTPPPSTLRASSTGHGTTTSTASHANVRHQYPPPFYKCFCEVLWWVCLTVCLSDHITRKPHE